jgi:predicted Fe-Mo cluster-binding NifX family protein
VDIIRNPLESHGPGDIPNYLAQQNVNILIVRGIGGRAISFFKQLGIQVIRGAYGTVNEILEQFDKQQLQDREYEVTEKFHRH